MIYDDYYNYNNNDNDIVFHASYSSCDKNYDLYNTPVDKIIDKHMVIYLLLMIKMMIAMISFPTMMMMTTNVLLFKLHNDKQKEFLIVQYDTMFLLKTHNCTLLAVPSPSVLLYASEE